MEPREENVKNYRNSFDLDEDTCFNMTIKREPNEDTENDQPTSMMTSVMTEANPTKVSGRNYSHCEDVIMQQATANIECPEVNVPETLTEHNRQFVNPQSVGDKQSMAVPQVDVTSMGNIQESVMSQQKTQNQNFPVSGSYLKTNMEAFVVDKRSETICKEIVSANKCYTERSAHCSLVSNSVNSEQNECDSAFGQSIKFDPINFQKIFSEISLISASISNIVTQNSLLKKPEVKEAQENYESDSRKTSTNASGMYGKDNVPEIGKVVKSNMSISGKESFNQKLEKVTKPRSSFDTVGSGNGSKSRSVFDPIVSEDEESKSKSIFDPIDSDDEESKSIFDPIDSENEESIPKSIFNPIDSKNERSKPKSIFDPIDSENKRSKTKSIFDPMDSGNIGPSKIGKNTIDGANFAVQQSIVEDSINKKRWTLQDNNNQQSNLGNNTSAGISFPVLNEPFFTLFDEQNKAMQSKDQEIKKQLIDHTNEEGFNQLSLAGGANIYIKKPQTTKQTNIMDGPLRTQLSRQPLNVMGLHWFSNNCTATNPASGRQTTKTQTITSEECTGVVDQSVVGKYDKLGNTDKTSGLQSYVPERSTNKIASLTSSVKKSTSNPAKSGPLFKSTVPKGGVTASPRKAIGKSQRKYQCTKCSEAFVDKNVHTCRYQFKIKCPFCPFVEKTKKAIKVHRTENHRNRKWIPLADKNGKPISWQENGFWECNECRKRFKTPQNVKTHVNKTCAKTHQSDKWQDFLQLLTNPSTSGQLTKQTTLNDPTPSSQWTNQTTNNQPTGTSQQILTQPTPNSYQTSHQQAIKQATTSTQAIKQQSFAKVCVQQPSEYQKSFAAKQSQEPESTPLHCPCTSDCTFTTNDKNKLIHHLLTNHRNL